MKRVFNLKSLTVNSERQESPSDEDRFHLPEVVIGIIVELNNENVPMVIWDKKGPSKPVSARSVIKTDRSKVGRQCTLVFENGDPEKPIITGFLQPEFDVEIVDPIEFGESSVVIRCGESRIELRKDGHIIIQGLYIDTQAYGPYRIKGASVSIN